LARTMRGFGGDDEGFGACNECFGVDSGAFGAGNEGFGVNGEPFGADNEGFRADDEGFGADNEGSGADDGGFGADLPFQKPQRVPPQVLSGLISGGPGRDEQNRKCECLHGIM
jgi:hypothetical protein